MLRLVYAKRVISVIIAACIIEQNNICQIGRKIERGKNVTVFFVSGSRQSFCRGCGNENEAYIHAKPIESRLSFQFPMYRLYG